MNLKLKPSEYYRGYHEGSESTLNCERGIEVALGFRYLDICDNDIIEIGSVMKNWMPTIDHITIDQYEEDFGKLSPEKQLRTDAEMYNYINKNVLSISTLEHFGRGGYGNIIRDDEKASRFLAQLIYETKSFLITVPVGYNPYLNEYIKSLCYEGSPLGCCAYIKTEGACPDEHYAIRELKWDYQEIDADNIDFIFNHKYANPLRWANALVVLTKGV